MHINIQDFKLNRKRKKMNLRRILVRKNVRKLEKLEKGMNDLR